MDRINHLHDTIQSTIISYLPTDAAIRTKILCKQWRNIWFPTDELVFRQPASQDANLYLKRIDKFIDHILPLEVCPKITKYELTLCHGVFTKSLVNFALQDAFLRQVSEVTIDSRQTYRVPLLVYEFTCLEKLTLRHNIKVDFVSNSCWNSIKDLTVSFTTLFDKAINDILEGCPNLDRLELNECFGFGKINAKITSSLRKLVLIQCNQSILIWWPYGSNAPFRDWDRAKLIISVPTIECLTLKLFTRLEIIDASSLVDVTIDLYPGLAHRELGCLDAYRENILRDLLYKARKAERIRIGTWCVKALSDFILRKLPCLIVFRKCKNLGLETPMINNDFPGIFDILLRSPNLETLVINVTTRHRAEFYKEIETITRTDRRNAKKYWRKKSTSSCEKLLQHLTIVRIVGLSTMLVDFLQFILENAKFLKKVVLTKLSGRDDQYLLSQKILKLPRSSRDVEILIF